MEWWHWAIFGLLLAFVEAATPGGFYAAFFSVSAFLVALLAGVGLSGPLWWQWLLFSVLSVVSLVVFRKRLLSALGGQRNLPYAVDSLVGELALLHEDLPAGAFGKAELHGTVWNVQNGSPLPLTKGQRYRVQQVNGLTLILNTL
ncbi:MAG: NfeD family protein [Deltaproteobacteria bacterium]|nr:NfeD family protein [Deltaproteobacteria bacterium]